MIVKQSLSLSLCGIAFFAVTSCPSYAMAVESNEVETWDILSQYADFKEYLEDNYNLTYDIDISYLFQAANGGGRPLYQSIYNPSLTWTPIKSDKFGTGSFNIAYNVVSYISKAEGTDMSNNLGVAVQVNDNSKSETQFSALYYTHTLPNNMFGVTLGQFQISSFDGTPYDNDQQTQFENESLTQNITSAYATSGLGGYVTFNPTDTISVNVGAQSANNINAANIDFHDLGKKYTTFGSVAWNPEIKGLGEGNYSFLVYAQPSVPAQPSSSTGFSVNLAQEFGEKWVVFANWNTASGEALPISTGMTLGALYQNPLNRNPVDQIALAIACNKINKAAVTPVKGNSVRDYETVVEAYWRFGITEYMQITPDVQLYYHPALDTDKDTAAVFSLRVSFAL